MNSRNLQQTGVGFIHSPGPDVVGHHTRLQDKGQFESRWDRKECQWCSLAEVHLPDMCKAQSSTFSSRKKKKKNKPPKTGGDRETVPTRGGTGPAWEAAMPSGLARRLCLCNAHMDATVFC